jgi:hypothetical protein
MYRVHFKWDGKDVQVDAQKLDLTHPYFVSIKDLVFNRETRIVINPTQEEVAKRFGDSRHLMIPFQSVSLIEEVDEVAPKDRLFVFPGGTQ